MRTLTKADHVSIIFGEWLDKVYGNTYYDATIYIGDKTYTVAYQYGYNAGDKQSIDEVLAAVGYRVRTNKGNVRAPYRRIHVQVDQSSKRNLWKETKEI